MLTKKKLLLYATGVCFLPVGSAVAACEQAGRCVFDQVTDNAVGSATDYAENYVSQAAAVADKHFGGRGYINLLGSVDFADCQDDIDCLRAQAQGLAANKALDDALGYATAIGHNLFGEGFRLSGEVDYSDEDSVIGNLDAVLPLYLSFAPSVGGVSAPESFFFQYGITRYDDEHDVRRDDWRFGAVYRYALSAAADADVVGAWLFIQQNRQRGHRRIALGGDYTTPWGEASLDYFVPLSDWRAGRAGYEERALEGGKVGLSFDVSSRLALDIGASRWEETDGSGDFNTKMVGGMTYLLFPQLELRGAWNEESGSEDNWSVYAQLSIPLGKPASGFPLLRAQAPALSDFYRPIESVGKIEVAERKARQPEAAPVASEAQVRFVQSEAQTGDTIGVEVYLPEAAAAELEFTVHLAPGSGDNPAVAGEDFSEEPILVTIREGELTGRAEVQLLLNDAQTSQRSIKAVVSYSG